MYVRYFSNYRGAIIAFMFFFTCKEEVKEYEILFDLCRILSYDYYFKI